MNEIFSLILCLIILAFCICVTGFEASVLVFGLEGCCLVNTLVKTFFLLF